MNGDKNTASALAILCLLCLFAAILTFAADYPSWWVSRNVVNTNEVANDFAPVTQGQLKHMAHQAWEELEESLPQFGGAGADVSNRVSGLVPGGDFYPVNLGQLKYVAAPFYDRLMELEYTDQYPWTGAAGTNDFAPANIGQVKNVFAFDLTLDTDEDGMPDWWELRYYVAGLVDPTNPEDADGDPDNDGVDNLAEFLTGTDPWNDDDFPHPVINEVLYRPTGAVERSCFIELYNPFGVDLVLSNYSLAVGEFGGVDEVSLEELRYWDGPWIIPAHGFFLIGGMDAVSTNGRIPDLVVRPDVPWLSSPKGNEWPMVVCLRTRHRDRDGLAYGVLEDEENVDRIPPVCSLPPHALTGMGESIARVQDGVDTDEPEDWVTLTVPTPTGSGVTPLHDPDDPDRDGLTSSEEALAGTGIYTRDSDGDGLLDGEEFQLWGTNPLLYDTDGDGLEDGWEVTDGLNPLLRDSDGDGLFDGLEIVMGLDPHSVDTDQNGTWDGNEDNDGDGFPNLEEQNNGVSPIDPLHTPASWDAVIAQWEHPLREWRACGGSQCEPQSGRPRTFDQKYCRMRYVYPDGSSCRMRVVQDYRRETVFDFHSILEPVPVYLVVRLISGSTNDFSVSGADFLGVFETAPGRVFYVYATNLPSAGGHRISVVEYMNQAFKWPYIEILNPMFLNLRAMGVSPGSEEWPGLVLPLNDNDDDNDETEDRWDDDVRGGDDDMHTVFVEYPKIKYFRRPVRLSWTNNVIRVHEHRSKKLLNTHSTNYPSGWIFNADVGACLQDVPYKGYDDGVVYIEGIRPGVTHLDLYDADAPHLRDRLKITVTGVDIAMDGNQDLVIDLGNPEDKECLFWLNDDHDTEHLDVVDRWVEDDNVTRDWSMGGAISNCLDETIGARGYAGSNPPDLSENNCLRDLEDFTAVQLWVPGVLSNLTNITYWMKFDNVTRGSPEANLFEAVTNGVMAPFDYLTNTTVSELQVKKTKLYDITESETEIAASFIRFDEPFRLLLEGKVPGKGDLTFLAKQDGHEIFKSAVSLDLRSISEFYDVYKVGREPTSRRWLQAERLWEVEVDGTAGHVQTMTAYTPEDEKHLLLVHGWNLSDDEKRSFAETAFKRLWWQGYKGRFGLFDWPTLYDFNVRSLGMKPIRSAHHYDDSEMIAWLSANALKQLMESLNTDGELRVWAHSMGNIVVGEAIRRYEGAYPLKRYIATQAAIPAAFYSQAAEDTRFRDLLTLWWDIGPTTPNIHAYWHSGDDGSTNQPYMSINAGKVNVMGNYINVYDYALRWWEFNNRRKPDDGMWYRFRYGGSVDSYNEAAPANQRFNRGIPAVGLDIIPEDDRRDRYAVFSYAVESRSKALGQVTNLIFQAGQDLRDPPLDYDHRHYSHSKQFRSNIIAQWRFYELFRTDCDL